MSLFYVVNISKQNELLGKDIELSNYLFKLELENATSFINEHGNILVHSTSPMKDDIYVTYYIKDVLYVLAMEHISELFDVGTITVIDENNIPDNASVILKL